MAVTVTVAVTVAQAVAVTVAQAVAVTVSVAVIVAQAVALTVAQAWSCGCHLIFFFSYGSQVVMMIYRLNRFPWHDLTTYLMGYIHRR